MFEGGFLLCAGLAALVVADARLTDPGRFSRALAWGPLHFIGTISYGIYLWHWPVIVYLNGSRTGLSGLPLDLARIAVTLGVSTASYYLVERPIRLAHARGWVRWWGAPLAGVVTAVLIVVATIPAVADPSRVVGTTHLATGTGQAVPGSGGYEGQLPIRLATKPSSTDPLRVMVLGDSVMHDASYGITAALQATGEATVATRTIDGFGLTTATNWPTSIPNLIRQTRAQLIVASWSWDQYGPTTPNALHQPVRYTRLLRSAVATMLAPGNGVEGVIFTEFPQSGAIPASNPAGQNAYNKERWDGVVAWNAIAKKMAAYFPGRVMYFPLAGSIMLERQGLGLAAARGRPPRSGRPVDPGAQARQRPPVSRGQRALRRRAPGRHDSGPRARPRGRRLVAGAVDAGSQLQQPPGRLPRRPPPGRLIADRRQPSAGRSRATRS